MAIQEIRLKINEVHSYMQRRSKMKALLVVVHPQKDSLTCSLTTELIRRIEKKVPTMKY